MRLRAIFRIYHIYHQHLTLLPIDQKDLLHFVHQSPSVSSLTLRILSPPIGVSSPQLHKRTLESGMPSFSCSVVVVRSITRSTVSSSVSHTLLHQHFLETRVSVLLSNFIQVFKQLVQALGARFMVVKIGTERTHQERLNPLHVLANLREYHDVSLRLGNCPIYCILSAAQLTDEGAFSSILLRPRFHIFHVNLLSKSVKKC